MAVTNTTTRVTAADTWTRIYDPSATTATESDFSYTVENFQAANATVQLAIADRGVTVADTDAFTKKDLDEGGRITGGPVLLESGKALWLKGSGNDVRALIVSNEG